MSECKDRSLRANRHIVAYAYSIFATVKQTSEVDDVPLAQIYPAPI
jgi:hypothetical protein